MLHFARLAVYAILSLTLHSSLASAIYTNTSKATITSSSTTIALQAFGSQDVSSSVDPSQTSNSTKGTLPTPSSTFLASSNGTTSALTGAALSSAVSCATALSQYAESSYSWSFNHQNYTSFITTATISASTWTYPVYASGAETTRLCDKNPRVIGTILPPSSNATLIHGASSTVMMTETDGGAPYPTPAPNCSINANDCKALYSYSSIIDPYTPQCSVSGTSVTPLSSEAGTTPLAFGSTSTATGDCSDCVIMAKEAQLLYWPIRTEDGSGELCSGEAATPAVTLSGTQTGTAPNSFVTDGVTITSPSVAISLTGISRRDGCYSTLDRTIIPVNPGKVTSIRGELGGYLVSSN